MNAGEFNRWLRHARYRRFCAPIAAIVKNCLVCHPAGTSLIDNWACDKFRWTLLTFSLNTFRYEIAYASIFSSLLFRWFIRRVWTSKVQKQKAQWLFIDCLVVDVVSLPSFSEVYTLSIGVKRAGFAYMSGNTWFKKLKVKNFWAQFKQIDFKWKQ